MDKGGSTDIDNCQMLCQTHNRAREINNFKALVQAYTWLSFCIALLCSGGSINETTMVKM